MQHYQSIVIMGNVTFSQKIFNKLIAKKEFEIVKKTFENFNKI